MLLDKQGNAGRSENGWQTYDLKQALAETAIPVQLDMERADKSMFDYRPLA